MDNGKVFANYSSITTICYFTAGLLVFKMNALRLSLYVWLLEIFAVVVFSYASTKRNVDRVCMGEYNHLEWISCFVDGTDFLDNVLEVQVL